MIKNKIQIDLSTVLSGYISLNKQTFDIKHVCLNFISQVTLDSLFTNPIENIALMYDGVKYIVSDEGFTELTIINPSSLQVKTGIVENGTVIEFFNANERGYGTNGWIIHNLYDGDYIQVSTSYYRYIKGINILNNIWSWGDEYSIISTTEIETLSYNIIQDNLNEHIIYVTNYNTIYQNQHKKHSIVIDCLELDDFESTYNGNITDVLNALTQALF